MAVKDSVVQVNVTTSSHKRTDAVLASFMNGIQVPSGTEFNLYEHKKRRLDDVILHGENENLEYDGKEAQSHETDETYAFGVYDPSTRSLKMVKALLVPCRLRPKKFRKVKDNYNSTKSATNLEQRSALGQEFGTRKAKAALSSYAKNKVDASKLEENELDIAEQIKNSTVNIPDNAQLEKLLESENRIIPPYVEDATSVTEIYPLSGIITEKQLSLLRIDSLLQEVESAKNGTDGATLIEYLPAFGDSWSTYLEKELAKLRPSTIDLKEKLQIIYYTATLLGLFNGRRTHNIEKLVEGFTNLPPMLVLEDNLKRFSDYNGFRKRFNIDPKNEDKLLSYLLVLMLKLNDYQLEIAPLAQELSLKPSRLSQLMRSLGCTLKNATIAQREAMGIPRSAGAYKVARLTAPLKLPQMTRRGRAGGR